MKKLLLLLFIPILLIACVKKEAMFEMKGQIKGYVFDSYDKPVEGAKVTVGKNITVTDVNGYFALNDLDIAGNPKYQLYIEKESYTPKMQEIEFNSTINANNSSSDSIPLNNSVVSIKVNLDELVDLKGQLKLPNNFVLNPSDTLEIKATLEINPEFNESITLSKVENTIDSNLNFTIKGIPRYGLFKNSKSELVKILSNIKIKLYINGSSHSKLFLNVGNIDLSKYPIEKANNRNIINLDEYTLDRLYSLTGSIYSGQDELKKDVSLRQTVKNSIVILSLNDKEIQRTVSNVDGKYTFNEVEPNSNYQLSLLSLDSDNDGKTDYSGRSDFEKFSIEKNQLNDKSINLWYQSSGAYSIKGTLYAGNRNDVLIPDGRVGLYSGSGLIDEVRADASGNFEFTNVTNKDVYVIAYDFDSDSNGYINFVGYKNTDASSLKTKVSLSNVGLANVEGLELFMKVNLDEPNYVLKLKGGNFFGVNSNNMIYNQSILKPSDSITLTFSKNLSQQMVDSLNARKVKIVTITRIETGDEITATVTLDFADTKNIRIEPASGLAVGTYRLQVNSELNGIEGYKYGVGNTINSQVLNSLVLTVEN